MSALLKAAKTGGIAHRPGARERVWRRVAAAVPSAQRAWWPVALAAAACAALVLTVWWKPPLAQPEEATVVLTSGVVEAAGVPVTIGSRLKQGAVLRTGEVSRAYARFSAAGLLLDERTLVRFNGSAIRLEEGSLALVVSQGPARLVQVADCEVDVSGGVSLVKVAPGRVVSVWAYDGSAQVRAPRGTVQLAKGQRWSSGPINLKTELEELAMLGALAKVSIAEGPMPVVEPVVPKPPLNLDDVQAAVAPPTPKKPREERQTASYEVAQALMRAGQAQQALTHYESLASGSGPWAETSLYEVGRIKLRSLTDPSGAANAFAEYQRRYPAGVLIQEAALNLIEAHLLTGDTDVATRAIDQFELTFPHSERLDDVRFLRANVRRDKGDCVRALIDYQSLATTARFADDALYFTAYCEQQTGRESEARRTLGNYLERFPSGRHVGEARAALGN